MEARALKKTSKNMVSIKFLFAKCWEKDTKPISNVLKKCHVLQIKQTEDTVLNKMQVYKT
jgi:hypothetical protein